MEREGEMQADQAEPRRSERERTMTDKGLQYTLELKQRQRADNIKHLYKISDSLEELLKSTGDASRVRVAYSDWLVRYEAILLVHQDCLKLCASTGEQMDDDTHFDTNREFFKSFKQSVEQWFATNWQSVPSTRTSVTKSSRRSSKASSQLSSAKLKESQKRVELLARAEALKEKQELEDAKLKLRQREEEFEIKTELKVSDAKVKALQELEGDSQHLNEASIVDDVHAPVPTQDAIQRVSDWVDSSYNAVGGMELNPHAPEWYVRESRPNFVSAQFQNASVQPKTVTNVKASSEFVVKDMLSEGPASSPQRVDNIQAPAIADRDVHLEGLFSFTRELNKPTAELQTFGGDPMKYNSFMRQFNARVVANTDSFEERLNYLTQFTTGEAHKIAMGYSHLDGERGYTATLAEFKDRYGDPDVVAQAYVKTALDWPVIKPDSAKSLDEYAIFLRECQFAVESLDAAGVLEYSENLKSLVKKLPYYLHDKWRNIVYDTKDRHRVLKFSQLVEFVRKEAKKATDPVYGKDVMGTNTWNKRPQDKQFGKSSGPRKNFSTGVVESSKGEQRKQGLATARPCLFCQGASHSLDSCKKLMEQLLKDRYSFLRSKGLCFACLRSGHQRGDCRQKLICIRCQRYHPSVLHLEPRKDIGSKPDSAETSLKTVEQGSRSHDIPTFAKTTATRMGAGDAPHEAVAIVPVRLKRINSDKYIETYAFLDTGSTATFCTEEVMRSLNIEGKKTRINLQTMGQETVQGCYVVSGLEVSSLSGEHALELPPVFTQTTLPVTQKDVISSEGLQKWPYLRDVPLQTIDSDVGLLIGVNVPKAMEPWDVIPSVENGPFAVKTLLGWVVNGPLDVTAVTDVSNRFISINRITALPVPSLEEQVHNQFNHDFSERTIDDVPESSREDKQFLEAVTRSVLFKDGHYTIDLPFKPGFASMPNNRKQADQRMVSLGRRFSKDDVFASEYSSFMGKVIDEGYARKVPSEQLQLDDGSVWYLPHHGVYHPRKNKLRVVFDCAARYRGTSLNDSLLQGPNLTNTLIGVLLRFRQEEIAIMGDIDSMFYQVQVPSQDSNFLRFLWWEDGDTSKQATEYQMAVHLFGATSSPSCANFALRKTALDCQGQFNIDVIDTVLRNFYVDDCLKSVGSVNDAVSLVNDLQAVLGGGGFHIAKWISNSREVMSSIPVSERAKEVKDLDLDQDSLPIERALGVRWCVESDTFCFKIGVKDQPLTRRGILSMVSSVYDPLGFVAPLMLKAKGILQELCKLQLGWDEQIPDTFSGPWRLWLQDLQRLADFKIDRCVKPPEFGVVKSAQLHHFADASEIGYGTVTYLRLENNEGKVHCSFIMGKSRVAPLKQTTIPRLELTAATVSARTDKMLKGELDLSIDRTVFWTDSMAVLRYIRNTVSRFHTFVANRLAVIHDGSVPTQWRYINTKLNPADLASRGLSTYDFLQERRWIIAPAFLWEKEDKWPDVPSEISETVATDDPEIKKVSVRATISDTATVETAQGMMSKLIDHHSSWFALKRSVVWILKVRKELLRRVRFKGNSADSGEQTTSDVEQWQKGHISVQDMNEAEMAILRFVQQQAFADEIDTLVNGRSCVKSSSYIRKLDPVMSDGLLRVGGRLHEASMPMESKHPVILPKNNHVSDLVLRQIHCDLKHSGRNHMLSSLRQRYWVVNAPSAIRKLISKCVTCRRQRSPVGEQKMANLPLDRLVPDEPPFTRVGVDYFGPFEIKQRRCRVKRYGVIFTCLTSRAVHLEVAASLDTDSYINALRRFVARRGQVTKMRSDNGTNFVGAQRELARAIADWNLSQIHDSMLQRNVDWQFNPPAGSHHGGVWERMIRTVRKVMNSVVREQTLDEEGLHTLMCEIEYTLNDRPITKNSDEPCDLEALTPNHLLLMKRKPSLPPGVFSKTDSYSRRRWKQVQYMANLFWQRWLREYLPLLQERQRWHDIKRNLKIGDVVLIVDSNAPRNSWPMGVVVETMPDRLGMVRQVKVRTSTNVLVRPIDKLCLILETD